MYVSHFFVKWRFPALDDPHGWFLMENLQDDLGLPPILGNHCLGQFDTVYFAHETLEFWLHFQRKPSSWEGDDHEIRDSFLQGIIPLISH